MTDVVLFYILVGIALASGAAAVTLRNLVHSALWLIVCFLGVACLFLMLQSEFLFAVQLAIYAGAIPILILFVLMLTREVMSETQPGIGKLWPLGAGAALAFLAITLPAIGKGRESGPLPNVPADLTERIGQGFVGDYVIPFEVASLLLLAALVGAIYLARAERPTDRRPRSEIVKEENDGRDTTATLVDRSDAAV